MTRATLDDYPTPPGLAAALARLAASRKMGWPMGPALEPSCGAGNVARELARQVWPRVIGVDVRAYERPEGESKVPIEYVESDLLDWVAGSRDLPVDACVGNPPFGLADAHLAALLEAWPQALVVMLLRATWFDARKRAPWLRDHPPVGIWLVNPRPSFRGRGTDGSAYVAAVWNGKPGGGVLHW